MSLNRWFAAAFAAVTLTRPTLAQAKADSASLRFAWPVGMTAHVEQERKVVTDFMARLAPKDADVAATFQSMRVANELTVVADPRDLRPYAMTLVKTVEVEGAGGPNEPAGRTRRVDIRTARYTYAR